MEINKEVTVKLTTKDLEEMIVEHLKSKGVDASGNTTDGELLKELIFKIIH